MPLTVSRQKARALIGSTCDVTLTVVCYDDCTVFQLKEFYDKNKGKFSFAERKMEQEMEGLQLRVDWRKRNYKTISSWLQKYREKQ
ncbi:hypothetical protein Cfor_02979 [Coptotermes formosanus]|jgi:hypothetical protein|uniref:Uncharacterized protein n=1 Tax=Coptotermes formosanus TaxID=36987 RepID=A0A6L2PY64_COPFO|nr:hypothetical protein Cfor_02979 [Coptotermes formosanus]